MRLVTIGRTGSHLQALSCLQSVSKFTQTAGVLIRSSPPVGEHQHDEHVSLRRFVENKIEASEDSFVVYRWSKLQRELRAVCALSRPPNAAGETARHSGTHVTVNAHVLTKFIPSLAARSSS